MRDHLLASQKRAIEKLIQESGLPSDEFSWDSHNGKWVGWINESVPAISHRDGYLFAFGESFREDHQYVATYSTGGSHQVLMKPGPETKLQQIEYLSWNSVLNSFQEWLRIVARETERSELLAQPEVGSEQPVPVSAEAHAHVKLDPNMKFEQVTLPWLRDHVPVRYYWALAGIVIAMVLAAYKVGARETRTAVASVYDQDAIVRFLPGELAVDLDDVYEPFHQEIALVEVSAISGLVSLSKEAAMTGYEIDSTILSTPASMKLLSATPDRAIVRADSGSRFIELRFDVSGIVPKGGWVAEVPAGVREPLGHADVLVHYTRQNSRDSSLVRVPIVAFRASRSK